MMDDDYDGCGDGGGETYLILTDNLPHVFKMILNTIVLLKNKLNRRWLHIFSAYAVIINCKPRARAPPFRISSCVQSKPFFKMANRC